MAGRSSYWFDHPRLPEGWQGEGSHETHNCRYARSDATPLPSVLTVLKKRAHIFVLVGTEVRGIITRADFNKPPVRVYLFGLLSLLEMHLGFWIRVVYQDSWQTVLPAKRLVAAKKRQADRQRGRWQNVSLMECLQFCDKRDLVLARQDLCEKLRLGSKTKASNQLRCAEDLRNLLAHSHQDWVKGSLMGKDYRLGGMDRDCCPCVGPAGGTGSQECA